MWRACRSRRSNQPKRSRDMLTFPSHRSSWRLSLLSLLLLAPVANAAASGGAGAVLGKMKAAVEPSKPSVRTMTFTVHSATFDENRQIIARQARKILPDGAASVTVVTEPESLKGVAVLV